MKNRLALLCITLLIVGSSYCQNEDSKSLTVLEPRVEYHENPEGLDVRQPRFSWILKGEGRNRVQSAYQITVASSKEKLSQDQADIWDSGKVVSNQTNQIVYQGIPLVSATKYYWKVRVWDESDMVSTWSNPAYWSMGLLKFANWQGLFIGHDVGYNKADKYDSLYLPPARYLRKSFSLNKKIKKATAYTTALGLYELRLNGNKVGEANFLPGWTDYNKRLYYQTFDITNNLREGENVIGAVIADGWYAGYIGYALLVRLDRVREFYGVNPSFMGQIQIEYEDGSIETIASDQTWKSNEGAIREADIIMGETYDARLENAGWDTPNYDDSQWKKPKVYTYPNGKLEAYPGTQVKNTEILKPIAMTEPSPGTYVFNLGKNIAGIAELKVQGPKGTKVQLRFGEILKNDGQIQTENLRKARATDTYILKGDGVETWKPKFTYHGFQYVEVTGFPGKPTLETITGHVLSSIETDASTFGSSNAMNNTLFKNIKTTQSANFFEIPTDCPQRDERLGWTGDAEIYMRSATYNSDVAAFMTKFLVDLDDAQRWYGAYPNFAPFPYSRPNQYAPAWMDAGVIIPYNLYKVYNDTRIVEYMYKGMEKFMQFQEDASTDYLRPGGGNNWGDWLAVNEETSHDYVGASFYGYDAKLMAKMAEALGKTEDATKYANLFENIKNAFVQKYILDNGRTIEDTQTSYALALYFDLYPNDLAEKGAARLAEKIEKNGFKFSTGFLGTKHVMLALSKYGYDDISYKIFQQTEYPSWGYSVENGSTSIWERWNSYTKDDAENSDLNAKMNSFSHYAFGSVAEWMFQHAVGIDTEDAGYRNIIIKPAISKEMDYINGSYKSINGNISSAWNWKGREVQMKIEIPVNTKAKVYIPTVEISSIKEGNKAISKVPSITILESNGEETILEIGSGTYSFRVKGVK
ncbi:family 78 glycoside hydrolase catalytic domain [Arenibacter sp. BSSL-BM3]|uniref:alpha-L-rhamnosidase n=1 Tax=Arenibacter arenosicollis TaxID=2762274 RepID=A0ABR7QKJ6_9FLAO|nr:alpha-L-rhamnosidase [Arenibacter arenosicollis]MBC8767711.1 family 78 glycoside hydrolase catalytic domain [Arenibacter arenosicollis]